MKYRRDVSQKKPQHPSGLTWLENMQPVSRKTRSIHWFKVLFLAVLRINMELELPVFCLNCTMVAFWACQLHCWGLCFTWESLYGRCTYSVLFNVVITWGTSVPVTYRTPPRIQLCDHSCWSHILAGKPHLGSFPSTFCTPALEGLVVEHTEPWTCASCHLVEGGTQLHQFGKLLPKVHNCCWTQRDGPILSLPMT